MHWPCQKFQIFSILGQKLVIVPNTRLYTNTTFSSHRVFLVMNFASPKNIGWKSSSRGYFMMCDFSKNSQFPFTNTAIFVSFTDSLLVTSTTEILDVKPFMSVALALNVISCFTANKTLPGMVTCYWSIINHGWEV